MDARLSTALPSHPKTKKLIRRLGEGAAWRLTCLFLWAASNRTDGDLTGMSDEDIELAVDWSGEQGVFVSSLREVGFIDGCELESRIHDWSEHNPWAAGAEDRAESSRWAAMCKRYGRAGAAERMPEYAERVRIAREAHAQTCDPPCESDAPSPSPIPTPNPKAKSKSKPPAAPASLKFTAPDWIKPEIWSGFVEMRKKRRFPLTDRACALICTELIKLKTAGNEPNAVLDQSTRNGWQDVYEIKSNANRAHSRKLTGFDAVEAECNADRMRESDETFTLSANG